VELNRRKAVDTVDIELEEVVEEDVKRSLVGHAMMDSDVVCFLVSIGLVAEVDDRSVADVGRGVDGLPFSSSQWKVVPKEPCLLMVSSNALVILSRSMGTLDSTVTK
jgi:hypothetical protein